MNKFSKFLTLVALVLLVIVVSVFTARHIALRQGKTTVINKTKVIDQTKTVYMTADEAEVVAVLAKRVEAVENRLMTDFNPQSTDRVYSDTNPKIPRVIARKRFDITLGTAGSVGVYGSTTVDLSDLSGDYQFQVIDVMIDYSAGGLNVYRKAPFTVSDTGGNISLSCYYDIIAATTPGSNPLYVSINLYSRSGSLNSGYQGTLIVYSTAWANPNDPESSY